MLYANIVFLSGIRTGIFNRLVLQLNFLFYLEINPVYLRQTYNHPHINENLPTQSRQKSNWKIRQNQTGLPMLALRSRKDTLEQCLSLRFLSVVLQCKE